MRDVSVPKRDLDVIAREVVLSLKGMQTQNHYVCITLIDKIGAVTAPMLDICGGVAALHQKNVYIKDSVGMR